MTPGTTTIIAVDARTRTEQRLVEAWATRRHPGATIVELSEERLPEPFTHDDETLVIPVRVTWLPRERAGRRHVTAGELLMLFNPRRPWRAIQPAIAAKGPGRRAITVGSSASVAELRNRYRTNQSDNGADAFWDFVRGQAQIACDRAEREIIGDRYKVPRLVASRIQSRPSFREGVRELSEELSRDVDAVARDAGEHLEELVAVQSALAVDTMQAFLRPAYSHTWDVDVDTVQIETLRELNRKSALVFLPSHRSYADAFILADVLLEHDFPRNHTVGGVNLSFWPLGPLAKRAGIVFIRRSFGDDPAYKFALTEYLSFLVGKRFNLEWYIEGGRTRTGKLRRPRYGMLRYLVAALEREPSTDAIVVPVSIVYEQLPEVSAMAAEELGAEKPRESIGWLVNYIKSQRQYRGLARLRFGDAFGLREALVDAGGDPTQLSRVASRICRGIDSATPATSTSVATLALLGVRDRALTLDQITRVVTPLLDFLDERSIEGPSLDLRARDSLTRTLQELDSAGVVEVYDKGPEPVWSIRREGHHVAAFYRNGIAHHLLIRAIVETALIRIARDRPQNPAETAWAQALRLRDLLQFEFFFPPDDTFREQLDAEADRIDPAWRDTARNAAWDTLVTSLERCDIVLAHHVLRSFLDSQLIAAEVLVHSDAADDHDEESFVTSCLALGRQLFLQGRVHGEESLSRELFSGAARLAENRGLLRGPAQALREGRDRFHGEVRDVIGQLTLLQSIEAELIDRLIEA